MNFPVKNLELKDYTVGTSSMEGIGTKYNLLANIKHEGEPTPNKGFYKVDVQNKAAKDGLKFKI